MNKLFKPIIIFSLVFISIFSFSLEVKANEENIKKIVECSNNGSINNFRKLGGLRISGSGQFNTSQIADLTKVWNGHKLLIIDLRQESHGFLNDCAFTYKGDEKVLNYGLSSNEVFQKELNLIEKTSLGSKEEILRDTGEVLDNLTVEYVSNENELAMKNSMEYIRIAVKENSMPNGDAVDTFMNVIKNKPEDLCIHIHCNDGKLRTATFMVMYELVNGDANNKLENIIEKQSKIGGVDLWESEKNIKFLNTFNDYVIEQKENEYDVAYSTWVKAKGDR